jgi:hypothetical protein
MLVTPGPPMNGLKGIRRFEGRTLRTEARIDLLTTSIKLEAMLGTTALDVAIAGRLP